MSGSDTLSAALIVVVTLGVPVGALLWLLGKMWRSE